MSQAVFEARTTAAAVRLFEAVRPELTHEPASRDNVYIALNALAAVAATVLAGTEDGAALDFFTMALTQNLSDLEKVEK